MSEATVTLDDYARMKNVAFRTGSLPVLFTPYLIWPTKEDRASGLLVPGIGYSNQRGGFLGLSYYWVTGRSTDLTTHIDGYFDGTVGIGQEARWRPTDESVGPLPGLPRARPRRDRLRAHSRRSPNPLQRVLHRCPTARSGPTSFKTETRWKLRLDHVADDLPFGFRGVLSIRDYSDEQFLQDFERNFNLSSARQILSQGFLTRNLGPDSLNIRFERSETFYSSTVIQERFPDDRVLPSHGAHRQQPVLPRARVLAVGALRQSRLRPGARDLRSLRRPSRPLVPVEGDSRGSRRRSARAAGSPTTPSRSTTLQTELLDENTTRSYAEAGLSLVGPSFSRIYDVSIGPYDKFKHVIEPRVDYTYVSDVNGPARDPGLRRGRHRAGREPGALRDREPPAGPAQPAGRWAPPRRSRRSRSVRPTRSSCRRSRVVDVRALIQLQKVGPVEGILRLSQGGLLQFDGRVAYDTFASQITSTSVTAGVNWQTNYLNASWFGSRPVLTTPLPPGSPSPNSDQVRLRRRRSTSATWFRLDTTISYDATNKLCPGGPLAADVQGLLLHDLRGGTGSCACRRRRAGTSASSST